MGATRKPKKVLTPREARTWKQIEALPRDNVDTVNCWMLLGGSGDCGEVTIARQRTGEAAQGIVKLPRREFERMIDWYNTGKWKRR